MTALPIIPPPELASAAAFNDAATANGWPAIADETCSFNHAVLSDLLALWRSEAAQGIPLRTTMTARKLQPFMRNIALYERIGEGVQRRYRVRLMGSGIVEYFGELTGKSFEEAVPPAYLPLWYGACDVPLLSRQPVRYVARADTFEKSFVVVEYFYAPLMADSGLVKFALLGVIFDGQRSWADVEAEARQRHGPSPA